MLKVKISNNAPNYYFKCSSIIGKGKIHNWYAIRTVIDFDYF